MKVRTWLLFLTIPLSALLAVPVVSAKSLYTPPGLYNVEELRFQNGLRLLLKPRSRVQSVSIRLVVHVGSRHFDCAQVETPHVVEHLLFSGTSKHSETELDRLIEEHGGTWNAVTGQEYTTYEIDIFDQYSGLALDTLYEIMTDPVFNGERLAKAKDIVARELGGRPSVLRRLLYRYDIGKTAWQKAYEWLLPGSPAACGNFPNMKSVTEDSITNTFRSFYTPQNMTLIIVGNFDWTEVVRQVKSTFGKMVSVPAAGPLHEFKPVPNPAGGPIQVSGLFAPFLGNSGSIGTAYRTAGSDSPDVPALRVLSEYLNKRLYEQVRVEKGLSYNPEVSSYFRPDYGIFSVTADTSLKKIKNVQETISRVLENVIGNPPSREEVEKTKQKMLLHWVQGYETNSGLADFYAGGVRDLDTVGTFRNYEQEIERVTVDDITRVIKTTLRDDRKVEIYGVPTISYTRFYIMIIIVSGVVLLSSVIIITRKITRRKRVPWYRR